MKTRGFSAVLSAEVVGDWAKRLQQQKVKKITSFLDIVGSLW